MYPTEIRSFGERYFYEKPESSRGAKSTGTAGAAECPCKHATAGLQGYVRFTIIIFA